MNQIELADLVEIAKKRRAILLNPKNIHILVDIIDDILNLETLVLCGNKLTNIPENVSKLMSLTTLDLSNNELTDLPESILNLPKLTVLNLQNNQLTKISNTWTHLTSLIYVNLDNNPLDDLSILSDLPALKIVRFLGVELPRRYWTKLSDWKSEWLLDETNMTVKNILIKHLDVRKSMLN